MQPDMPKLAMTFGAVLALLGVVSYAATGQSSLTALIPSAFGLALAALGFVAKRPAATKHAMHAAAVLALLGVAGSWNGLPDTVRYALGSSVEHPAAALAKSAMALLMAVFLYFCVQSFRQARKARS